MLFCLLVVLLLKPVYHSLRLDSCSHHGPVYLENTIIYMRFESEIGRGKQRVTSVALQSPVQPWLYCVWLGLKIKCVGCLLVSKGICLALWTHCESLCYQQSNLRGGPGLGWLEVL